MKIVFLGLSITSSWGNGHATNYRGLCNALRERGHDVLFFERDVPWYRAHRDFDAQFVALYKSIGELSRRFGNAVRTADLVVVGSFVPEGADVGGWVIDHARGIVAFWDIDTPITAEKLARGDREYLTRDLAARYDIYLSFTGGPLLERLGARRALPFYCLVDPAAYRPLAGDARYTLGYLGTYSADRHETLRNLLLEPARILGDERFVVAGPQYPDADAWPANVERTEHVPPPEHARFYASQRLTLNVTRQPMVEAGWSPSVRLFEAAACGVPIVTDWWEGLDSFFSPGSEIVVARTTEDVLRALTETSSAELAEMGRRARARVLAEHTADRRAAQLERYVAELVEAAA